MKEIVTFLGFDGNCREAMEFYRECFGAELYVLPYSAVPVDLPWVPKHAPKNAGDRIIHSTLTKESRTLLMAADSMKGEPFRQGDDCAVMIHCESLEEIERLFAALGDGGTVTMPLQDTFWGARYGRLTDRFGTRWMFNFAHSG